MFVFQSCKKRGCTNRNATNYSENALHDNGSCTFGAFSVSDSITAESFTTTDHYTLEIVRASKKNNTYYILNYANKKKFDGGPTQVLCHITDNFIFIPEQTVFLIENPADNDSYNYIKINQSGGHFSNDSIFIDYNYTYTIIPHVGACWGN